MRNRLLATVAVAAVVGFGGFAAAQSQMGGESNKPTSGATQEKSGGSMSGAQSGGKTLSPSSSQSSNPSKGESAQGMQKSGKDNERLGQGPQQEKSGTQQKGAQQERGTLKDQKGAQEEGGKNLKGAQEQRGMQQKGAQEQRGMQQKQQGAQEQRAPSTTQQGAQPPSTTTQQGAQQRGTSTGANVGTSGGGGGSVQLSENQRSQIKTVIGRGSGPRLSRSDVSFSISVGTRVPRTVHFVTLPEEIVIIVPQYRGFDYFLIEDEIVIVDPRTLEIVAVIPA